jgi:5-oxoprolinase (ATP-hydrolysing) subunit A
MGEGCGNDAELMPFISSANIACGYHAGDEETMKQTVALCVKHGVAIGAHPSYVDKENFGRVDLLNKSISLIDIPLLISSQLFSLQKICDATGATLHHVKPHGALYNRAAKDRLLAGLFCKAIAAFDNSLVVYGLSGSEMESAAQACKLQFMSEVFADRTYQRDGSLTPRTSPHALIQSSSEAIQQAMQMIEHNQVTAIDGTIIPIKASTICIHGDGPHALAFAKGIYNALHEHGITISAQGVI